METTVALVGLPTERLEQLLVETAARMNAGTARWLALVEEFDRREGWASWECRSMAHWLSWHCGVAIATARDQVRVARALRELPVTREAMAAGDLSYSKVRALVRYVEPHTEASLVEMAKVMTAAQVEAAAAGVTRAMRDEDDRVRAAFERRYLDQSSDDDGSLVGRFRIPADAKVGFKAALEAKTRDLAEQDRAVTAEVAGAPVRTAAQRRVDALVELVIAGASAETSGAAGGVGVEVLVETTAETIANDGKGAWSVDGLPIPSLAAELLACECAVQAVVKGRNGEILDLGRRQRLPSPRQKRALRARDKGCTVPGCTSCGQLDLDGHHIRWWGRDLGGTDLDNLTLVCRYHHRLIHMGRLSVQMVDGTPVYTASDGRVLEQLLVERAVDVEAVVEDLETHGWTAGGNPRGHGERMDRHWVVGSICDHIVFKNKQRAAQNASAETVGVAQT